MGAETSFPYPEREELCLSLGTAAVSWWPPLWVAPTTEASPLSQAWGRWSPLGHLTSLSKTEIITPPLPGCWEDSLVNAGERALKVKGVLEMLS